MDRREAVAGMLWLFLTATRNARNAETRGWVTNRVLRRWIVIMPVQIKQLSTPNYQSRKGREQKKSTVDSPASATPTLVDP